MEIASFFHRSPSSISNICNHLVDVIENRWGHVLEFTANKFSAAKLTMLALAVSNRTQFAPAIIGFLDGTCRPIARPSRHQRIVFTGHKWRHALKYQYLVTPDGIIYCWGPVAGRHHDSYLLRHSGVLTTLASPAFVNTYFIYGDRGYQTGNGIVSPIRGNNLTASQQLFNTTMSAARVTNEWAFHYTVNMFRYLNFTSEHKSLLSPVGSWYRVGTILANCRTCLRGNNQISRYYDLSPPTLADYLL